MSRKLYGESTGGGGRGTVDAADSTKVEKLSDEVVVLKRMLKDQGMHVFSELEGMKKQMSQMFDMMQKVMAAASSSAGSAQSQPPKSPSYYVSG